MNNVLCLALCGKKIGFEQVIGMIDDLLGELKTEQQDDDNKKEKNETATRRRRSSG